MQEIDHIFYKENVKCRFITLVLRRWGSKRLLKKISTSADIQRVPSEKRLPK